jgi:PIN domain nuclease of toxin-antitoxin system
MARMKGPMATRYAVDTHALLWYLAGDARLGQQAEAILREPSSHLILPIVALAEACWIVERGRSPSLTVTSLLQDVDADPRITIEPLTRAVLDRSLQLTSIQEIHDRQIVATALGLSNGGDTVVLLTRDQNITSSGLIPVKW